MDYAAYKLIAGYIVTRLEESGYYSSKQVEANPQDKMQTFNKFRGVHGLDRGKLTPCCIMYTPSRRPDGFFQVTGNSHRGLDVYGRQAA
jgi:hypothetical protein